MTTRYGGKIKSPEEYIAFLEGVINAEAMGQTEPTDLRKSHEISRMKAIIARRDRDIRSLKKDIQVFKMNCDALQNRILSMGRLVKLINKYPEIGKHVEAIVENFDEMIEQAHEDY